MAASSSLQCSWGGARAGGEARVPGMRGMQQFSARQGRRSLSRSRCGRGTRNPLGICACICMRVCTCTPHTCAWVTYTCTRGELPCMGVCWCPCRTRTCDRPPVYSFNCTARDAAVGAVDCTAPEGDGRHEVQGKPAVQVVPRDGTRVAHHIPLGRDERAPAHSNACMRRQQQQLQHRRREVCDPCPPRSLMRPPACACFLSVEWPACPYAAPSRLPFNPILPARAAPPPPPLPAFPP